MSNQLYPTDLTDNQWDIIRILIPPPKPGGRPRTLDMRMVINAILYVVVGGIKWRMLPREMEKCVPLLSAVEGQWGLATHS